MSSQSSVSEGSSDYEYGGYHPVRIGDVYNDYIIEYKLGYGAESTVWLASNKKTNEVVALKIQQSNSDSRQTAFQESRILKKFHSPQIMTMLDSFFINGPHGNHFCFVLEAMDDCLLCINDPLSYKVTSYIAKQILLGLSEMNESGLLHGDIKPDNILISTGTRFNIENMRYNRINKPLYTIAKLERILSSAKLNKNQKKRYKLKLKKLKENPPPEFHEKEMENEIDIECIQTAFDENRLKIKIGDLGGACLIERQTEDYFGTTYYIAPETIVGYYIDEDKKKYYDETVDIWALGCIVFELITGLRLFEFDDDEEEQHLAKIISLFGQFPTVMIKKGEYAMDYFNRKNKFKGHISKIDFSSLITENSNLTHDEFRNTIDFLEKCLCIHPRQRSKAKDLLNHPFVN